MANRRKQLGISRHSSRFEGCADEGIWNPPPPSSSFSSFEVSPFNIDSSFSSSPSSLAAKAIRASSARRDSTLSSVYGHSNFSNASLDAVPSRIAPPPSKELRAYEYTPVKSLNESKHGIWGVLTRKAKSILDDDNVDQQHKTPEKMGSQMLGATSGGKFLNSNHLEESNIKRDSSRLLKGLEAISSSLSHIGGTIGNALEEGLTIVENRTSDIIQETQKHIIKKPGNSERQGQETNYSTTWQQSQLRTQMQTNLELQLKASRDHFAALNVRVFGLVEPEQVAMAMAAKAKLLIRELKTVKADFAFAKDRCAQLEQENKILRENHERGGNPEDDDLIRLQLETLLAAKARLANENSIYARENGFLREVVEYHQLTMQDVVYFDESNEEVTEVNPLNLPPVPNMQPDSINPATSQSLPPSTALGMSSEVTSSFSSISGKDSRVPK